MNQSIFLMLIAAYGSLGVVGFRVYRGVKKNAAYLAAQRPAGAPLPPLAG